MAQPIKDFTIEQLEAEAHQALAEAIPPEEMEKMTIGQIGQARAEAIHNTFGQEVPVKCTVTVKYTYWPPPPEISISISCEVEFAV